MSTTLLVAEKPKVAARMAQALGDYDVEENYGVKNYRLDTDRGEVIIAPAVGHMFTLEQKDGEWTYPVFDIEWVPSFESDDGADYIKKYVNNMQKMAEEADEFINGCDFDVEGSVIGYNAIMMACGGDEDRMKRMKFSTLTHDDLRAAFDDLNEFDRYQTEAGLTRHVMDWYYGINLSRALMIAVKSQDRYQSLSTGRVQGPALKIAADREREIQEFEPEDYWELYLVAAGMEAQHQEDRFWDEDAVDSVLATVQGNDAVVADISRRQYTHNPPNPFNLTDLQNEAYSQFNISPKKTQQLAQNLYESSLISYPRTSSQQLSPKIGYTDILSKLKKQDEYEDKAQTVLDMSSITPRNGKKEDEAHPAIHPTGNSPGKGLSKQERKIYDLVVKRFMATFGKPAKRESLTLELVVEGEAFDAKGKRTLQRNWYDLYDPYVRTKEIELPDVEEGQQIPVEEFRKEDKETQPPKRYTQSSLISALEDEDLGTKATRANIVENLYDRKYIEESSIEVTDLGMAVVESLEEHCPDILSPELTRAFEKQMESIRSGEQTRQDVLEGAKESLQEILATFKEHEEEIGAGLIDAVDTQRKKERQLGPCGECEDGTLRMIKTNNGRFVGCSNYPDCENSFPLPHDGKIESLDEQCDTCGTPRIKVIRKGKRPYDMCIDPDCATKDDW